MPISLLRAACLTVMLVALTAGAARALSHIYVDQAVGTNTTGTAGTAAAPFKSITYALTIAGPLYRNIPDPLVVHVKTGLYDADPAKSLLDRETFPIKLRPGMTLRGDDGVENCIISGAFSPGSTAALLRAVDTAGILITGLTLRDMHRVYVYQEPSNGGALEAVGVTGAVVGCVFENNFAWSGGAVYLESAGRFDIVDSHFIGNSLYSSTYFPYDIQYGQKGSGIFASPWTGEFSGNVFTNNDAFAVETGIFSGNVVNNRVTTGGAWRTYQHGMRFGNFTGDFRGNTFNEVTDSLRFAGYFNGNVSGNVISGDIAGGLNFASTVTGTVTGNILSGNSKYSGLLAGGLFSGEISGNLFSGNSNDMYGGGIQLNSGAPSDTPLMIANNVFVDNFRGDGGWYGSGIYSAQKIAVVNNTFVGGVSGETGVRLKASAAGSILKNNIFADVSTAVLGDGEVVLEITDNVFFNVTDVINWNSTPYTNDLSAIEFLLATQPNITFSNNHTWPPGIKGEDLVIRNWTADAVYDADHNLTILTDASKNWTPNQWQGALVNLAAGTTYPAYLQEAVRRHYPIVGNSATQIMVRGDLSVEAIGKTGQIYTIDDYHLAPGTPSIDAGTPTAADTDMDGGARPQGAAFDIGADEFMADPQTVVTVTASSTAGGRLAPQGRIVVPQGGDLAFDLLPDPGYYIADLRVDGTSVGARSRYAFSFLTADRTIEAVFAQSTSDTYHTITASAGPGGDLAPAGNVQVLSGTNQTFHFTPLTGYAVADVLVDNVSVGAPTQFTFDTVVLNHTLHVSYQYVGQTTASTITCDLSAAEVRVGAPLRVSGQIAPDITRAGAFVDLAFTPPSGPAIHRTALANSQGVFDYDLPCGLLTQAGAWSITAAWSGEATLAGAVSLSAPLTVTKAQAGLTLAAGANAVKAGTAVTFSGKLTPEPDCGGNLAGIPLTLNITAPDQTLTQVAVETSDGAGHYAVSDWGGFDQLGDWTVAAAFAGTDAYAAQNSAPVTVRVTATAGYAIVIQGKVESAEGLASHNKTTQAVYAALKDRDLLDEDILYFNYDTTQPGVDAVPSAAAVQAAITVWARDRMDPAFVNPDGNAEVTGQPGSLYVFMVDHGLADEFYLHPDTIAAADLDAWLDTLQAGLSGDAALQDIVVVLGFCRSGSFIDDLAGARRVVVASAAADESSYKGLVDPADGIRDGEYFFDAFFKQVTLGRSVADSFATATQLTEAFTARGTGAAGPAPYFDHARQHPLLDDNFDGVGSNALSGRAGTDGEYSRDVYIGWVNPDTGNDPGNVRLTGVTPARFLAVDAEGTDLWAKVSDVDRVARVWVEIKAPDLSPSGEGGSGQAELGLTAVEGTYDFTLDRYAWPAEVLPAFAVPGTYELFYFVEDDVTGATAPFMTGRVYRALAGNAPPLAFDLLAPADGEEVLTTALLSWQVSTDPEGHAVTYTLLLSEGTDAFDDPLRIESLAVAARLVTPADGLKDLTTYYWRVQAVDAYGAVSETPVRRFATNNTNPVFGWIEGHVFDTATGALVVDAQVSVGGSLVSAANGYYLGIKPPGIYTLTVTAPHYAANASVQVQIPEGGLVSRDVGLSALPPPRGDLDGDYRILLADVVIGLQLLAGHSPGWVATGGWDVDADQAVGLAEVLYDLQVVAGLRPQP